VNNTAQSAVCRVCWDPIPHRAPPYEELGALKMTDMKMQDMFQVS